MEKAFLLKMKTRDHEELNRSRNYERMNIVYVHRSSYTLTVDLVEHIVMCMFFCSFCHEWENFNHFNQTHQSMLGMRNERVRRRALTLVSAILWNWRWKNSSKLCFFVNSTQPMFIVKWNKPNIHNVFFFKYVCRIKETEKKNVRFKSRR